MEEYNLTNATSHLTTVHYVAIPLYFTFGIVSLIGNIILILAMYRENLLNYGGYLTLAHSAGPDLIFGSLNVFYVPWAILLQSDLITPNYIPGLFINLALYAKKVFLVFMACTKFCAVVFPYRARGIMTITWYKRSLCIVWLISAFIALPLWIIHSGYVDYVNYKWTWSQEHRLFAATYWAVTNFVAIIIFIISYPVCFYKLRKHNLIWSHIRSTDDISRTPILGFREKSILYIFVVDAVVFTIWCVPPYLFELGNIKIPYFGLIKEISRGLLMCYSPIVYWLLNKNIRHAINKFLCRLTVCKNSITVKVVNNASSES